MDLTISSSRVLKGTNLDTDMGTNTGVDEHCLIHCLAGEEYKTAIGHSISFRSRHYLEEIPA